MGALRAEPARFHDWTTKSVRVVWNVFDVQLVLYALLLAIVGLMMAFTNSSGASPLASGTTFSRGLLWLGVAIIMFTVATALDYHWLKTFAWPLYLVNIGLLLISLFLGSGVGDVNRWVTIFGLQFQFSEIAKVLMIVVLANFLAARQDSLNSVWTVAGACVLAAPPLLLVLVQPDLGTSLVFGAILFGTLFLSGVSLPWIGLLAAAVVAAVPIAWSHVLKDYQKQRLLSFLDPTADPQGSGYQLVQSQIAVGSGGVGGKGLTNGSQGQLDFLPEQSTDFVFATLAEELGFVGGVAVLLLFCALLWRILLAGWRADDPFGVIFAGGLASMILFQVLVNIGMVIGIMPVTGIPLPFITHGGASLVSIAVGLGILQSINLRQSKPRW